MIKGVNRQMIEVCETDNPYFERALLIVRSSCAGRSNAFLRQEGHRFVNTAGSYSELRRNHRHRWLKRLAWTLFTGGSGVLLGLLVANVGG